MKTYVILRRDGWRSGDDRDRPRAGLQRRGPAVGRRSAGHLQPDRPLCLHRGSRRPQRRRRDPRLRQRLVPVGRGDAVRGDQLRRLRLCRRQWFARQRRGRQRPGVRRPGRQRGSAWRSAVLPLPHRHCRRPPAGIGPGSGSATGMFVRPGPQAAQHVSHLTAPMPNPIGLRQKE